MKVSEATDIAELAQNLASKSVVTKALGRYLEMVLTAVYDDEIKPLRRALEEIYEEVGTSTRASMIARKALGIEK